MLPALDGLLISGGADVDPATYDAAAHPAAGPFRADRDNAEFALVRAAVEAGVPVLGICRGLQVLNVALGGDLIQHLPEIEGVLPHAEGSGIFSTRAVTLDPDSWIGRHVGRRRANRVPSPPGRRPGGARASDRGPSRRRNAGSPRGCRRPAGVRRPVASRATRRSQALRSLRCTRGEPRGCVAVGIGVAAAQPRAPPPSCRTSGCRQSVRTFAFCVPLAVESERVYGPLPDQ